MLQPGSWNPRVRGSEAVAPTSIPIALSSRRAAYMRSPVFFFSRGCSSRYMSQCSTRYAGGHKGSAMTTTPRRDQLLDRVTDHVLEHGLIGLTLRPVAAALGTSDRMLLYHF